MPPAADAAAETCQYPSMEPPLGRKLGPVLWRIVGGDSGGSKVARRFPPSLLLGAALVPFAAPAQSDAPVVVPVEQASYHVPSFSNGYTMALSDRILPQRSSGYHRHSLDSMGVLIAHMARTGQVLGAEATATAPRGRAARRTSPTTTVNRLCNKVTITGDTPFHNIVVELLYPTPGEFTPGARTAKATRRSSTTSGCASGGSA